MVRVANDSLVRGVTHLEGLLARVHVPATRSGRARNSTNSATHHLTPICVFAKSNKSCTVMKLTNAYPTLQPGCS